MSLESTRLRKAFLRIILDILTSRSCLLSCLFSVACVTCCSLLVLDATFRFGGDALDRVELEGASLRAHSSAVPIIENGSRVDLFEDTSSTTSSWFVPSSASASPSPTLSRTAPVSASAAVAPSPPALCPWDGADTISTVPPETYTSMLCQEPIDAVYTWVNGSDPVWFELMVRAKADWFGVPLPPHLFPAADSAGGGNQSGGPLPPLNATRNETGDSVGSGGIDFSMNRYRDNDELRYSFRSLEKYAPWIRHIYLVTNGQVPSWLDTSNPHVSVITHEDIFLNKSHLPVFSSPSIEVHLHRIPGLSRRFVYFNDDVMLGSETWPDDFLLQRGSPSYVASPPSSGQRVYLSWEVPKCNPGCPDSWLADGFCDSTCNVSRCLWDAGDCLSVNGSTVKSRSSSSSSTSSYSKGGRGVDSYSTSSSSSASSLHSGASAADVEEVHPGGPLHNSHCFPSCTNDPWLGDQACDVKCAYRECGWDGGDCGMALVWRDLDGAQPSLWHASDDSEGKGGYKGSKYLTTPALHPFDIVTYADVMAPSPHIFAHPLMDWSLLQLLAHSSRSSSRPSKLHAASHARIVGSHRASLIAVMALQVALQRLPQPSPSPSSSSSPSITSSLSATPSSSPSEGVSPSALPTNQVAAATLAASSLSVSPSFSYSNVALNRDENDEDVHLSYVSIDEQVQKAKILSLLFPPATPESSIEQHAVDFASALSIFERSQEAAQTKEAVTFANVSTALFPPLHLPPLRALPVYVSSVTLPSLPASAHDKPYFFSSNTSSLASLSSPSHFAAEDLRWRWKLTYLPTRMTAPEALALLIVPKTPSITASATSSLTESSAASVSASPSLLPEGSSGTVTPSSSSSTSPSLTQSPSCSVSPTAAITGTPSAARDSQGQNASNLPSSTTTVSPSPSPPSTADVPTLVAEATGDVVLEFELYRPQGGEETYLASLSLTHSQTAPQYSSQGVYLNLSTALQQMVEETRFELLARLALLPEVLRLTDQLSAAVEMMASPQSDGRCPLSLTRLGEIEAIVGICLDQNTPKALQGSVFLPTSTLEDVSQLLLTASLGGQGFSSSASSPSLLPRTSDSLDESQQSDSHLRSSKARSLLAVADAGDEAAEGAKDGAAVAASPRAKKPRKSFSPSSSVLATPLQSRSVSAIATVSRHPSPPPSRRPSPSPCPAALKQQHLSFMQTFCMNNWTVEGEQTEAVPLPSLETLRYALQKGNNAFEEDSQLGFQHEFRVSFVEQSKTRLAPEAAIRSVVYHAYANTAIVLHRPSVWDYFQSRRVAPLNYTLSCSKGPTASSNPTPAWCVLVEDALVHGVRLASASCAPFWSFFPLFLNATAENDSGRSPLASSKEKAFLRMFLGELPSYTTCSKVLARYVYNEISGAHVTPHIDETEIFLQTYTQFNLSSLSLADFPPGAAVLPSNSSPVASFSIEREVSFPIRWLIPPRIMDIPWPLPHFSSPSSKKSAGTASNVSGGAGGGSRHGVLSISFSPSNSFVASATPLPSHAPSHIVKKTKSKGSLGITTASISSSRSISISSSPIASPSFKPAAPSTAASRKVRRETVSPRPSAARVAKGPRSLTSIQQASSSSDSQQARHFSAAEAVPFSAELQRAARAHAWKSLVISNSSASARGELVEQVLSLWRLLRLAQFPLPTPDVERETLSAAFVHRNEKASAAAPPQSAAHRGRRLGEDTYGDSLIFTNRLISKRFGKKSGRKVPAHMPHMIDSSVMSLLQSTFSEEFEDTSRHRFRSSFDVQYGFAYFHFLMEGGHRLGIDLENYWQRELDTNMDGILDDNEFRTLAAVVMHKAPTAAEVSTLRNCIAAANATTNSATTTTPARDVVTTLTTVIFTPAVTMARLAACESAMLGLRKNARDVPTHLDMLLDEVAFEMITDDYNKSLAQLDLVRGRKAKFVCINDDMKEAPEITRRALQAFFEASYPLPSQFELPKGASNPVLYIKELKEWLQENRTRHRNNAASPSTRADPSPFKNASSSPTTMASRKVGKSKGSSSSSSRSSNSTPSMTASASMLPTMTHHAYAESSTTLANSSNPPFLWWISVALTLALAGAALGFASRAFASRVCNKRIA